MKKLKILIVGPEKCGKSLIATSLYNPQLNEIPIYRPTIGVRIIDLERNIQLDSKNYNIKIQIFDISGSPQFEQLHSALTNNVDGIIIVCNADIPSQAQNLQYWIDSFPKKLQFSPSDCLGFANHITSECKNQSILKCAKLDFNHCSFETKQKTTHQLFDKYVTSILQKKLKDKSEDQDQNKN